MSESMVDSAQLNWKRLYVVGGTAALLAVLVGVVESAIQALPGAATDELVTVVDWFVLFQRSPFMGLRNLGLLNMFFSAVTVPIYLALYVAHRRVSRDYAALAVVIALVGVAVFFATNRALPMLDLSNQYAAATTDAQRVSLVAAGRAMLSVGASHTPGTFLAFLFADVAGILMSVAMLRGKVFGRANAYLGILGFSLLLISEVLASFVWTLDGAAIMLFGLGGLVSSAWNILLALRLFQLARQR